jgi:hypothetical protein
MAKSFYDLSEKDILALAISLEEEDGKIYGEFAERMRPAYPKTAESLDAMREEESGHRHHLTETYRQRFGDYIPLLRRQDVKGFVDRKPIWLNRILTVQQVRNEIGSMEQETQTVLRGGGAEIDKCAHSPAFERPRPRGKQTRQTGRGTGGKASQVWGTERGG